MSAYWATSMGKDHRVNQDTAVVYNKGRVHTYVVCDGHGDHGEKVSKRAADLLPSMVLSNILRTTDFENSPVALKAVQKTLTEVDDIIGETLKSADSSGCTAAGVVFDNTTKIGYMYGVGDSLVMAMYSDGTNQALHLQNASNAPQSIVNSIDDATWRTRKAHMGGPSGGTKYMLFPGDEEKGGLQLYSTLGDFDLKGSNSVVKVYPQAMKIKTPSSAPRHSAGFCRMLVASDGYLDGIDHRPFSSAWYDTIRTETDAANGDARDLVDMAEKRGSTDDITVLSFVI